MTAPWVRAAQDLLAQGYGAEDIAQRLDVPVNEVRQLIGLLRLSGALQELYQRAK